MGTTDWIDLAQGRNKWQAVANAVMNFLGSINCWKYLEYVRNS